MQVLHLPFEPPPTLLKSSSSNDPYPTSHFPYTLKNKSLQNFQKKFSIGKNVTHMLWQWVGGGAFLCQAERTIDKDVGRPLIEDTSGSYIIITTYLGRGGPVQNLVDITFAPKITLLDGGGRKM